MAKNPILSNKAALLRALKRMKEKQEICMKYSAAHKATNDAANRMHDTRNIVYMALLAIDTENVPKEEWEMLYNVEVGKMVADFNTPDPETRMPYSEMVKPHIKKFYDNLTTADMVTDWSDDKQIEKFLWTILNNQTQSTLLTDFAKQCSEVYPTHEEHEALDSKCEMLNVEFYDADRKAREYGIKFSDYISLVSVPSNAYYAITEEFVTKAVTKGVMNNSDVYIDVGSYELMDKFLKGQEFSYKNDDGSGMPEEFFDFTHEDLKKNFVDTLLNVSKAAPFERLILGEMNRTDAPVGFTREDIMLINGRPLSDILREEGKGSRDEVYIADKIRDALLDGNSVVEIMRVGYSNDGKTSFRHQEIKVDLDKLNSSVRQENHNIFRRMLHNIGIWKIPDRYPTNAQRDSAQEKTRVDNDLEAKRAFCEKKLIDKFNKITDFTQLKAEKKNSFLSNFPKLEHVTNVDYSKEFMRDIQNSLDHKPEPMRESFIVHEATEKLFPDEVSRPASRNERSKSISYDGPQNNARP